LATFLFFTLNNRFKKSGAKLDKISQWSLIKKLV